MSTIQFQVASLDQIKIVMNKVDIMLGEGVASNVIGELWIILATGKRVELFLVSDKLVDIFKKTQGKRNPYCLGIYFGDLLNDELLLSIEGATLCSPYTDRKVKVSHKGEQAVLYGRDVQRSSIEDFPSSIRRGQKVIIVNRLSEVLALGKALINGKEFHDAHKDSSVVKNILDRGWYLRKGA
jgi:predicted RNA-binding protein (TIGR00451 family)